jgi:HEAT repeat protein
MYRRGLPGNPEGIASIRILGSSFVRTPARNVNADPSRVAAILEMTRSDDPDARADGYTRLSQLGPGNETIQRSAFHQGLSDSQGEVRAAALMGLHGVDPEGSRDEMMRGLKDGDANVRLAAFDLLGNGPGSEALLKQGLNDPDELVKELARLRLGLPEPTEN